MRAPITSEDQATGPERALGHPAPKAQRRGARQGPLILTFLMTIFVAGNLILTMPATAAVSFQYLQPPYTGVSHGVHRDGMNSWCHSSISFTAPKIQLSTGDAIGSDSVTATSCTSTNSGNGAHTKGTGGIAMAFTNKGGRYVFKEAWSFHLDVKLDLNGADCSDPGQSALAFVQFTGFLINVTGSGTELYGDSYPIYHDINTTGSKSWTYSLNHNVTWGVTLDPSSTYEVGASIGVETIVLVNDGTVKDVDTCSAAAGVSPTTGSSLGTLDRIAILHY